MPRRLDTEYPREFVVFVVAGCEVVKAAIRLQAFMSILCAPIPASSPYMCWPYPAGRVIWLITPPAAAAAAPAAAKLLRPACVTCGRLVRGMVV